MARPKPTQASPNANAHTQPPAPPKQTNLFPICYTLIPYACSPNFPPKPCMPSGDTPHNKHGESTDYKHNKLRENTEHTHSFDRRTIPQTVQQIPSKTPRQSSTRTFCSCPDRTKTFPRLPSKIPAVYFSIYHCAHANKRHLSPSQCS